MDSSICVAVITGLPTRPAWEMRSFWMTAICSTGSFHAEIAARHHDAVARVQNLVEMFERIRTLDLRR